jgi:hypothetical protein
VLGLLSGGPAYVPGLYGQITTTANSVVVFSTDGGIFNTGSLGAEVRVDIRIMVDGFAQALGRYEVEVRNFANSGRWSFSIATTLAPGVHVVGVDAMLSDLHRMTPADQFPTAFVGGASDDTQGRLTAVVLKQ